jgi:hypothetical protein
VGYCLLGAHVNSTAGGLPETIAQWKPPLVVILDHSDAWHDVKRESPQTVLVGRLVQAQSLEPDFNNPDLSPTLSARAYCDRILPWAERMGTTYSFWQGVNEPTIQSVNAMHRFAEFEAERVRIMGDRGFAVVVGSFSVGNPEFNYWPQFLPALTAAFQYKGALALHEYAWPTLDFEAPWYLLRHRKVYNGDPARGWDGFPKSLKALPLLITECGLDGLIEKIDPPRGWKALYESRPDEYLRQLTWYDAELQQDLYVAGAALYCLATPDVRWQTYDIWPELARTLARQATPIYRLGVVPPPQPPQPPEPPQPPQPEPPGWSMKVEYRPGARIIAGSFPRAGIELTVADPWGHAVTLISGTKPEYGQGGFEALAPQVARYTLTFLDETFILETRDSTTLVTFSETGPTPEPPSPTPDDAVLFEQALARLDEVIRLLELRLHGNPPRRL